MKKSLLTSDFSKLVLSECYAYNKSLQELGTMGGLLSIGAFFVTKTFYLIYSSTVSAWVLQYPSMMRLLLIASLIYTASLLLCILCTRLVEIWAGKRWRWLSDLFRGTATLLILPFELSIYGIKSIIVITFTFRSDYRNLFLNSDSQDAGPIFYAICILVYLDFLITVVICYMKCSILRPLIPNGGFFSKIDGNFEYFFILLIPLKHLCFYLTNSNDQVTPYGIIKAKNVVPLYYFMEIFLMIVISAIYLKELPYYNALSERILAHFLLTTSAIFILLGAFENSLDSALKVYLFFVPIQLVSFEYFLRNSYRLDFHATIQAQQYLSLKKILIEKKNHTQDAETEDGEIGSQQKRYDEIFDQGTYVDYVKKKKTLTQQEYQLWQDIQKFRRQSSDDSDNELDEDEAEKIHKEVGRNPTGSAGLHSRSQALGPNPSIKESYSKKPQATKLRIDDEVSVQQSSVRSSKNSGSRAGKGKHAQKNQASMRAVNHRVEALVVNSYVDNNSKSPYAHLIRIYWMLTSKVAIFGLYKDLKELLELSTNFRSQTIYFYALKEVENYLKIWYDNPAAVDIEGAQQHDKSANMEQSNTRLGIAKGQTNTSLNIAYGMYHFHTMKYLNDLVGTFASLNRQFIELLKFKASFKQIDSKLKQLIDKDSEIGNVFGGYHRDCKPTEKDHLLPYILHLSLNTNMVRSGKFYLTEYTKRNLIYQKVQEERNPVMTTETILIDSLVFFIESDTASLGTILEVYGDSQRLLSVDSRTLVGKSPNYLLPDALAKIHPQLMRDYMEQPLRYFFGENRESIVKIPGTNLVIACQIAIKVVPTIESAFRLVLGLKPNLKKYNHRMVLNRKFEVECFSENFLATLKNDYLQARVSLDNLSPALHDHVLEKFEQAEQYRGDYTRQVRQKKIAKRFKRLIRAGLVGANNSKDLEMVTLDSKRFLDSQTKTVGTLSPKSLADSDHSGQEDNNDQGEIFRIGFPGKLNKNKVFKSFEVFVDLREFGPINQKIIYLELVLLDENDQKLQMLKNQNFQKTETLGPDNKYASGQKGSATSAISRSDVSQQPAGTNTNKTGMQTEFYQQKGATPYNAESMTNLAKGGNDENLERAQTNPRTTKSVMTKPEQVRIKVTQVPLSRDDLQGIQLPVSPTDILSSNQPSQRDSLASDPSDHIDYEEEEFDEFFIPASELDLELQQNPALNRISRRDSLKAPVQSQLIPHSSFSDQENARSESEYGPSPIAKAKYTANIAENAGTKLLKNIDAQGFSKQKDVRYKFFGLKDARPLAADVDSVKEVVLKLN